MPPSDKVGPSSDKVGRHLRRLADARQAQALLVWLSFLEAIIIPIPLEAVLVPYMLARRDILWRIATLALAGFLVAALFGYLLGSLAFNTLGIWSIEALGWQEAFGDAKLLFARHGFWALVLIGLVPIPSQVAMLAGGAFGFSLPLFMAAMALSRGVRYFGLALLVVLLGPRILQLLDRLRAQSKASRWLLEAGALALVLAMLSSFFWLSA
jgi:membrane protein YqaA with SNARE-associated domain